MSISGQRQDLNGHSGDCNSTHPVDEQLIQGQIKSEDPLINLDSWKEGRHTSGPAKRMSTAWVQAPCKMPGMLQGPLYQCHLFWLHEVWEGRTTH